MRAAWAIAACATLAGGCSAVDGRGTVAAAALDPTKVYLEPFQRIQTTRQDVDQYRCLNGAPLTCTLVAIRLECECLP